MEARRGDDMERNEGSKGIFFAIKTSINGCQDDRYNQLGYFFEAMAIPMASERAFM